MPPKLTNTHANAVRFGIASLEEHSENDRPNEVKIATGRDQDGKETGKTGVLDSRSDEAKRKHIECDEDDIVYNDRGHKTFYDTKDLRDGDMGEGKRSTDGIGPTVQDEGDTIEMHEEDGVAVQVDKTEEKHHPRNASKAVRSVFKRQKTAYNDDDEETVGAHTPDERSSPILPTAPAEDHRPHGTGRMGIMGLRLLTLNDVHCDIPDINLDLNDDEEEETDEFGFPIIPPPLPPAGPAYNGVFQDLYARVYEAQDLDVAFREAMHEDAAQSAEEEAEDDGWKSGPLDFDELESELLNRPAPRSGGEKK